MATISTTTRAGGRPLGASPLGIELQMLLRTLAENQRPMSAFELTNHWTPTWSLQEVQKFMQELVQLGWVQADGRESKVFYIIDRATTSGRKP